MTGRTPLKRVAVLGGGHQGYAVAADLAHRGFDVGLWRRTPASFGALAESRTLRLHALDGTSSTATLQDVSGDLERIVSGADAVIVAVPSSAHEDMAGAVAPFVRADAPVLIAPGNLGSLAFARALSAEGHLAGIAEIPHPPFGARKRGEDEVLAYHLEHIPVGVLPATRTDGTVDGLRELYGHLVPAKDVLDTSLMSHNIPIHPALIVSNAGPIDAYGDYHLFTNGTTPATTRLMYALDAERMALRELLGYGPPHYDLKTLFDPAKQGTGWYPPEMIDVVRQTPEWTEPIDLVDHRYLTEDTGRGLAMWSRLARLAGSPAPVMSAVLRVAEVLSDRRFDPGSGPLGVVDGDLDRLRSVVLRGWGEGAAAGS